MSAFLKFWRSISGKLWLMAAIITVFTALVPAVLLTFRANQEYNRPPKAASELRQVVDGVRLFCASDPDPNNPVFQFLACPSETFVPRPKRPERPATFLDPFDPRPWVQQTAVLGIGVTLLAAALLATLFARRIASPIEAVSRAAQHMAAGDLSVRVPIGNAQQGDETARLAQSFNHMAQTLETQSQERKNMVADIAHELRTPLTVMQAKLEALQDGVMDLSLEEVGRLHHQTQLLARLVDDLRLLSLADAGQLKLELRNVDVARLLHKIVTDTGQQASSKGIRLVLEAPETLNATVDPDRFTQVILNFLSNALRHTPESGCVEVSLAQTGGHFVVRVRDSGPGLSPQTLTRVFDRFYRADASRNRQTGGSGLGLAIVRAIVEAHRGEVKAENATNGGAAFSVSLPC